MTVRFSSLERQTDRHSVSGQDQTARRPQLRRREDGRLSVHCRRDLSVSGHRLLGTADQEPEIYNEQAERNRIKSLPIVAPRGKILDRDGRVIVDNHSTWSLILSRENLKTEHLHEIADGLHLDYDDLVRKVQRYQQTPQVRAHHH